MLVESRCPFNVVNATCHLDRQVYPHGDDRDRSPIFLSHKLLNSIHTVSARPSGDICIDVLFSEEGTGQLVSVGWCTWEGDCTRYSIVTRSL